MHKTNIWQLQEAKSKFSELVEFALSKGPEIVTKRGVSSVVILSIDEFNQLKKPKDDLISFFKRAPKFNLELDRKKDYDLSLIHI